MTANPEADVIAAIDALERDDIDELVDWQMTDSPAAQTEHGGARVRFYDRNGRTLWSGLLDGPGFDLPDNPLTEADLESWGLQRAIDERTRRLIDHLDERNRERANELARERVAATFSFGNPCRAPGEMYAVTPGGERIEPDADGVLRCAPEDDVIILSGGGGGGVTGARVAGGRHGGNIDAAAAAALAWAARVDPPQFPRYHTGSLADWRERLRDMLEVPIEGLGTLLGTPEGSGSGENVTCRRL